MAKTIYVPDPKCRFKKYLTTEDGKQCALPCCMIGYFECQFVKDCIPCPLRWQYKDFNGWDDIDDKTKIAIVDNASDVVKTLASSNNIEIPAVTTLFDLLDATRIVQSKLDSQTSVTRDTLESIAETLMKLGSGTKKSTQT